MLCSSRSPLQSITAAPVPQGPAPSPSVQPRSWSSCPVPWHLIPSHFPHPAPLPSIPTCSTLPAPQPPPSPCTLPGPAVPQPLSNLLCRLPLSACVLGYSARPCLPRLSTSWLSTTPRPCPHPSLAYPLSLLPQTPTAAPPPCCIPTVQAPTLLHPSTLSIPPGRSHLWKGRGSPGRCPPAPRARLRRFQGHLSGALSSLPSGAPPGEAGGLDAPAPEPAPWPG